MKHRINGEDDTALISILKEWINVDSTSGKEAQFLIVLETFFSSLGYQLFRQKVAPERWNLLALRQEAGDIIAPTLLFSTHVDCVPPFFKARVETSGESHDETTIYGRGACDTKGGMVAMVAAAEKLIQEGHQALGFLFVVGEEVDHCGAKIAGQLNPDCHFSKYLSSVEQVILCEPTLNHVTQAQKGMLRLHVHAKGKACHSAYPERGSSAIETLLDVLYDWRNMPLPKDEQLGPTTVNIGSIHGGVAANVLAPEAQAVLLVRAVSSADELLKQYEAEARGRVNIEVPALNDPVFFSPPEGEKTSNVSFNTDASYMKTIAPIWLVGPGDIEVAHSDHEHITLASLKEGIDLYVRLGRQVLGEPEMM